MKTILLSLAFTVSLFFTTPAALADINQFAGEWKNADPNTRGLTSLRITVRGTRVGIQAWGKCQPSDCAWGYSEATAYGPSVEANLAETAEAIATIYITSFSQTILIIHPVEDGQLQVELMTKFTDQSGRAHYRQVEKFSRMAPSGGAK